MRGLVHKIERQNDEFRSIINKKDVLFSINSDTDKEADEYLLS